MHDATTLAGQIATLSRFFGTVGFSMPPAFRAVLGHPERLPSGQYHVFVVPEDIVALNEKLRKESWMNSPGWPDAYLAIGEDPGANVVFFDATKKGAAVWLADIDLTTTDRDPSKCSEVVLQAPSFSAYAAGLWQRYLEQEGECPLELYGDNRLFEMLRSTPTPEMLEMYFLGTAVLYEACEAWRLRMGDSTAFFAIINLDGETAQRLVMPCMELAVRQPTPGRFRAALNLLQRLVEKCVWENLPAARCELAKVIRGLAANHALEAFEPWRELNTRLSE